MEATPENFKALFEIVQRDLATSDASTMECGRSLRRRKSDPHHPKGTPENRKYYNSGRKHWQRCVKEKGDSLSGSTGTIRRKRKVATSPKRKSKAACPPNKDNVYGRRQRFAAQGRHSRITANDVLGAGGAISDKAVDHDAGADEEVQNATPSPKRKKGSAYKAPTGGKAREDQRIRSRSGRSSAVIGDATDSSGSKSFGHESD